MEDWGELHQYPEMINNLESEKLRTPRKAHVDIETQMASYIEMCFIIRKYLGYAISLHFTFQIVELRKQQRRRRSKQR